MDRAFAYVSALLTIVWFLFLLASSSITLIVKPVLDLQTSPEASIARTLIGLVVFGLWIFVWQKLAENWFFKILLRRRRS